MGRLNRMRYYFRDSTIANRQWFDRPPVSRRRLVAAAAGPGFSRIRTWCSSLAQLNCLCSSFNVCRRRCCSNTQAKGFGPSRWTLSQPPETRTRTRTPSRSRTVTSLQVPR